MTDFYRMGKHYASLPRHERLWFEFPPMSLGDCAEFNRGFDDAKREQLIVTRLMIALAVVAVCACVFFWWIGK